MLKYSRKFLMILLNVVAVVSFVNVLIMYWFPIKMDLSSFSAVRIMFLALIEKRYYLILFSLLICALLLLTAVSVRKQHILLPILSVAYLMYDFIVVMLLLLNGLSDGYWKTYIIQALVVLALIVLLCMYLFCQYKFHKTRKNDVAKLNEE